ncbi:hypothetical protein F909_01759 [Acinetobacter sp. ANC 3929]|uniref:putative pilus system protein FilA n=1 Tax=unclassified Acinetobacter TaxID=196816 RepID=UPI0002CE0EB0|nr:MULTISPECIES: DUF6160 family protein [unclassified Acinetobacter]ENW82066.1 hypothetical protein F909_01759 [Acinetobacter sp. ANC 3929]MCH7352598.1 pilus assembly protein FilA [Acinetobacter sp. NIPH 2023]MCH7356644.1 pilus assembly protein FilA [Acinetobacter sp. NIPH 1958]MCH7360076.1 pilus assembly protein FilA [Acinetobacter sp. NIPH 2024]
MKMFTKLALVSSMAISANAMAMQSMDDAALSAATGQDGINIGLGISKVEIEKVLIHDNDGLATTSGGTATAGAIVISGNGVTGDVNETQGIVISANTAALLPTGNLADLVIDTDAGTGANGAFLNVAANVSGLNINIGKISVAKSGTTSATSIRRGAVAGSENAILSGLSLKTGTMTANIQLGAAPQGAMIKLNTIMTGGLEIKNLGILDNSTALGTKDGSSAANRAAGEIHIDSIKVADATNQNLTVDADISVVGKSGATNATAGYLQIVGGKTAQDIYINGVYLGSKNGGSATTRGTNAIGDVEVQGLQTYYNPTHTAGGDVKGAAITISGH